ncbi:MAG: dephospho-CoA kinase [Deltaproteobacteria bacterium]|nr:dephospho-CoA kinase [Deltaproteobacteria bacterium]
MKPRRIALTGGIATGKSTVAGMFAELGAVVLDADQAARDVVEPGHVCWHQLREAVGASYFEPDGHLRRKALRDGIIRDASLRSRVNAILHPAILKTMDRQWREWRDKDPRKVIIFDIPLLFELGLDIRFDTIILVYVPEHVQIERLMSRDGLSRDAALRTLSMQSPIEWKKKRAQIVIDNSKDLSATRGQVKEIWVSLTEEENWEHSQ